MKWVYVYLILISAVSVAVCVFDKISAHYRGRRVRERTLFFLSALGGGAAMYLTMRIIRHKTQKNKFMLGIPAIIFAQLLLCLLLFLKFG